jgi:predicted peroxiredoxin
MKMLLWATSGANDPTKASIPLHVAANGCIEAGQDPAIILAGDAADLITGDNAETMEGVGIPPVRELLAKLREHSIPVYV